MSAWLHFHNFLDDFAYITYFPRRQLCLSCVVMSPAFVVPPEVNADQRRGALLFPAGLWRAAAGDSLRSDHLQPVWRRLLAQRDGVSIKSQISHTACVENGDGSLKQATKHTLFKTQQIESVMCNFSFYIQGVSDAPTGSRGVPLGRVSLSLHPQQTLRCPYRSLH